MVRAPCCEDTSELTKGPWTKQEDKKLIEYVRENGHENWRVLPKRAGLNRCGKSCRLRWINYLRPGIKRGDFSKDEEQLIIRFHAELGNKWSKIASYLPGRTDNEIKNYWNTHMRKKRGIDPKLFEPLLNPNLLVNSSLLNLMKNPYWNNAFNHINNFQLPALNLMQMLNQNAFDPANFLLRNVFDPINQLQLSQNLMQLINPNPIPNLFDTLTEINCPQQEPFHGLNNSFKNPQIYNTLPTASNSMASLECDFEPKLPNACFGNYLDTDYIPKNETLLPNLISIETPNIDNQVERNFSPVPSPSSIIFDNWDRFWDDEANLIQWPENV